MTTRQPDVTREQILDAAFSEIYHYGFQAASLSNILARTGLTKGALYHHFASKQELGLAVVEEVLREGFEAMIFAPLRESDDPFETLREQIRTKAEKEDSESVVLGCPLNNLMQEMSPVDPAFKDRLLAIIKSWQDAVAGALARAQKQGRVRQDVDCKAAALFIVSSWEGCVGVAKNMQSVRHLRSCLQQLQRYVSSLAP